MIGYKIFKSDNSSPIKGDNKPVFPLDTTFPLTLPKVQLDTSNENCGEGWNFCDTVKDCIDICDLFSNKGINNIYKVQGSSDSIKRTKKNRCSELTILGKIMKEDFINCEPNKFEVELFDWINLPISLNKDIIVSELLKTLAVKKLDWTVIILNYNYYNNIKYYNNNNYYYVLESLIESNKDFKQAIINAYKAGMYQLRFNEEEKQLIALIRD